MKQRIRQQRALGAPRLEPIIAGKAGSPKSGRGPSGRALAALSKTLARSSKGLVLAGGGSHYTDCQRGRIVQFGGSPKSGRGLPQSKTLARDLGAQGIGSESGGGPSGRALAALSKTLARSSKGLVLAGGGSHYQGRGI